MQRSAGVTFSAVVAIVGSVLTILFGLIAIAAFALISVMGPSTGLPGAFRIIVIVEAAIILGFGGWGLASGIGLIKLKQWARISTIVFAVILVLFSLPPAVLMAFVPFPSVSQSNVPAGFMVFLRVGMVIYYAAISALGGFWLYFFNKRSVKVQFQAVQPVGNSPTPNDFRDMSVRAPTAAQRVRPLSITIIGWFLLIGSGSAPLFLLMDLALFDLKKLPLFFLGFFLSGRGAWLVFIAWMVGQVVAATGLLKLKKWGLYSTIGLQCLVIVNTVLLIGIPANLERFQEIMDMMMASLTSRMPFPIPLKYPIALGMLSSLPIVFAILWFLIAGRDAFRPSQAHQVQQSL